MAAYADIFAGLKARCESLSVGSPPMDVVWPEPETVYEPESIDSTFLEVLVLTNVPRWQALGSGDVKQGLLQITFVGPKNRGIEDQAGIVDAIIAHFPNGQSMGPAKVTGHPWAASPLSEDHRLRIPVSIPWTA